MTSQPQGKDCLKPYSGSSSSFWRQLFLILLEHFDLLAHILDSSYSHVLILHSQGEPQQQNRILTQFWLFCRQNMTLLGSVNYFDFDFDLGVLGHLDLEELGVFCWLNLIQIWVVDYLYLEEFGEFCQLNLDPVWASGCLDLEDLGVFHQLILE